MSSFPHSQIFSPLPCPVHMAPLQTLSKPEESTSTLSTNTPDHEVARTHTTYTLDVGEKHSCAVSLPLVVL